MKQKEKMSGWLSKWTNYLKGYRQRWFVLNEDGKLSYYRSQSEVGHSCRGTIMLSGAYVHTVNSSHFVVCGGTQTFYLRGANEVDRQRWVTALELCRHKAIEEAEAEDEKDQLQAENDPIHIDDTLGLLQEKLDNLTTCYDLIASRSAQLQKQLEKASSSNISDSERKALNDGATLFLITINATKNACKEFVDMARNQGASWKKLLQHEQEQKNQLQSQLERLAKQHSVLEQAAMKQKADTDLLATPIYSDSDDEFHDAIADDECLASIQKSESHGSSLSEVLDKNVSHTSPLRHMRTEIISENENAIDKKTLNSIERDESVDIQEPDKERSRRTSIPHKPPHSLNLWTFMRNCIGKDLSRIPLPVNFNEPISFLQRITEDMEYSYLLDQASKKKTSTEQLSFVAAFIIGTYSTSVNRVTKPFNPLLGETFEMDRTGDLGWKSIAEQVSHHPPAAAQHIESSKYGWKFYQDFTMTSKFRGKYLSVIPLGTAHLTFANGNHYSWRKITSTVHNIIVGKLWLDHHGEFIIENHKNGDKATVKFYPYSYFSREEPRRVSGLVQDKYGVAHFVLQGFWDRYFEVMKVVGQKERQNKPVFETQGPKTIWKISPPVSNAEKMYFFTRIGLQLNEPEDGVAPTDSRLRPDQRLMEVGDWDEANKEKMRLEEKQRATRRQNEADAEKAVAEGRPYPEYRPVWFTQKHDEHTGSLFHTFNGLYWASKEKKDWKNCPDIF